MVCDSELLWQELIITLSKKLILIKAIMINITFYMTGFHL